MDDGIPFEVGYEKAKNEILKAISSIGQKYSIPTSILTIMLHDISNEAKLNTYELILGTFDISAPQSLKDLSDTPDKVVSMKDEPDKKSPK